MIKPAIIIPSLLLLILACTTRNQPVTDNRQNFRLPVIVEKPTGDTIEYLKADFISEVYFTFAGKSKFTDTLLLDNGFLLRDTTFEKDVIREYSCPAPGDSLATDGFQIFPDYNTSIHYKEEYMPNAFCYCYFPVYVVNETSTTKVFIGKDSHVFGIQEAIDRTDGWNHWHPIEGEGFDFCGNGYFGLKVHPGEFVMFLVPKYQGEERDLMRIRLEIGESLYISRSYEGTFSVRQFNIPKTLRYHRYLSDPKNRLPYSSFYGAIPKGYDAY